MDCKHVNDNLVDYLYQELDADELDRIEHHLKECQGCASELEAFESTRQLMRQLPELEPSSAVTDRLLKEAARAIQPEETVGFWDRVRMGLRMLVVHPAMTAAVALVLVLGVSFYAYRHTSPPKHEGALRGGDLPTVEKALRVAPTGEPTAAPPATEASVAAADEEEKARQQLDKDESLRRDDPRQEKHRVALVPKAAQPAGSTGARGRGLKAQTGAESPKARPRPRPRRPKRRRRARTRPGKPKPRPAPKTPASYRKGPAKEAAPAPAPVTAADSWSSVAGGKSDDDRAKKTPKQTLVVTGKGKLKKEPGARYWLLRARQTAKAGRYVQALRLYHRALQQEPKLRRTLGKEVQYCARNVARGGPASLKKIQQQLPLLAGWLEAEIATARRRARARKKAKPAKRATSRKKKAPAAQPQQKAAE